MTPGTLTIPTDTVRISSGLPRGFVEYNIPNFIPSLQKITQLTISAELSSEAPGVNNVWPSDISFYLNDVCIGNWLSPGDFGDSRGLFTPDWWFPNWNQYGLLKLLVINRRGTFIDGLKISDVTIDSFHLDYRSSLRFRLAVDDDAEHVGGLTIFGKTFGNYGQDIKVKYPLRSPWMRANESGQAKIYRPYIKQTPVSGNFLFTATNACRISPTGVSLFEILYYKFLFSSRDYTQLTVTRTSHPRRSHCLLPR